MSTIGNLNPKAVLDGTELFEIQDALSALSFRTTLDNIATYVNAQGLPDLTDGTIWIGNGSNVAIENTLSGDITMDNTGVVTIANDAITNLKVAAAAAIEFSKMEALGTDFALVTDGSGFVSVSAVTATELGFVSGVTSSIQTQLNGKEPTIGFTPEDVANKVTTIGTPGNDTNYPSEQATREALDLKEDSLGFTPEDVANKGAVSGYAGLDASQELLLTNFPTGTGLQILRRNTGNTALEFFTLTDLQGIVSINADTTAAQLIVGTASVITVGTAAGTTTIDIDSAYVGQTSITTLGTITTGVWNGTAITASFITLASTDLTDSADLARDTNNLSFFAATTSAQLLGIISDETGTGLLVFGTNPTIVTPTIASFTNAAHDHTNAAGGAQLLSTAALSDTADIAYINTANVWSANLQDFSGATLRIPVSATPSVTTDGDIAFDSLVTDFSTGLIRFFGAEEQGIVTMPIAEFITPTDGSVISYNATNDEFELITAGAGDMILSATQTVTGAKTFDNATLILAGSTSGTTILNAAAVAGTTTVTLQAVTGTVALLEDNLGVFAATTSAQLLAVISDETGTGLLVFGTSPTIVTPTIASFTNATHNHQDAAGGGTLLSTSALSDTADIAYLNTANVFGDFDQTFQNDRLLISNPADTNQYTITAAAIAANRILNLPLITATDTLASLGLAQTFSVLQSFSAGIDVVGNNIDNIQNLIHDVSTSGTDIDFTEDELQTISISANTTFTTTNRVLGKSKTLKITTDGTLRTFTFPGWDWVSVIPANQAASKDGYLTLTSYGTTDADIVAAYQVGSL